METKILVDLGFIYDEEDNLWYDNQNLFRVRVNSAYRTLYYTLFYGGYTVTVGAYATNVELVRGIIDYIEYLNNKC